MIEKLSLEQQPNSDKMLIDSSSAQMPQNPMLAAYPIAVVIKDGDFIPFEYMHKSYGRAEFTLCPQYKRGKLVKLFIYPLQQEDRSKFWVWEGNGKRHFTVQSYDKLDEPKLWMHSFCKEHKCQSIRLYVPNNAKFIWFSEFSDNVCVGFTQTEWKRP